MLRIGVLSDTHLPDTPEAVSFLQQVFEQHFRQVEMILHAGDIVAPEVLIGFTPCPVLGVRGNMDPPAPDLPHRRVIHAGGACIGLIHGWGARVGLVERVRREFSGTPLDCLVFGHSHVPMSQSNNGLLLFNPGSATDRRGMPRESVGILEIEDGKVRGRIIMLAG